jgi:hypothetical protein
MLYFRSVYLFEFWSQIYRGKSFYKNHLLFLEFPMSEAKKRKILEFIIELGKCLDFQ